MVECGRKCLVAGCLELAKVSGLCCKHYKRKQRHGSAEVRKTSGGSTSVYMAMQHPLYKTWSSISRVSKGQLVCERWKLFENFVQDMPPKPEGSSGLYRRDKQGLYELSNVYWAEHLASAAARKQQASYMKGWYAANPNKARDASLKKMYGITAEWYDKQHETQKGLCAICGKPEAVEIKGKIVRLAVDHCHETGKVRGLLCMSCNRGLGAFKHSPDLLRASVKYLRGQ